MIKKSLYQTLVNLLWVILILLLPITSLPLITRTFHTNAVAAPSILVLLVILVVWFIPYLVKNGSFPYLSIPFFAFIATAVVSSLLAFFLPILRFRDIGISSNEIAAFVTLGVGACFYLVTACWATLPDKMKFILRFINWAGVAIVAWGSVQAYHSLFLGSNFPAWMYRVQDFTSNGMLYVGRVSGFALEPSWLAHQMNLLFLPYWLGASIVGFTAHKRKLFNKISLENVLLIFGVFILILSSSRIGLLSFVCCIGFLIILGIIKFYKWLSNKITARTRADRKVFIKWVLPVVFSIILITCVLGLFLSAGFVLSKIDWRMAALLNPKTYISKDWFQIANEMVFAERIVFWQTGMKVFNDYPLLGVGLGNNGYFFPQKFDGYAWSLPEVQSIVNSDHSIPNAKNFWVRLLSETGVIGFAFFIGWLVILWISTGLLSRSMNKIDQVISLMGRLAIIAFFFEGFSIDTFGLPYIWISLGLITAGWTHLAKVEPASMI